MALENWVSTYKIMEKNLYLMPYTEVNSKWIRILTVKPKTIKLLEESLTIQDLVVISCIQYQKNIDNKMKK